MKTVLERPPIAINRPRTAPHSQKERLAIAQKSSTARRKVKITLPKMGDGDDQLSDT